MNNSSKKISGFVIIIILMLLGSTSTLATYISLLFIFIIALTMSFKYYSKPSYELCTGLLLLLFFQNLCIGVGAHLTGNTSNSLKFMTQVPYMVIIINWLVFQKKYIKNKRIILTKEKVCFLLLLICIFFSLVFGRGNIQSILVNFRNLTIFFMVYELGYNCLNDEIKLSKYVSMFLKLLKYTLFVGIIFMIFGYPVYKFIGIHEVYIAKGTPIKGMNLDNRFYTTLISKKILRMGSIYYEPVNLAYVYAIGVIISLFYVKNINKKIGSKYLFFCILGLFLTFGKGGYLIVICTLGFIILTKILKIFLPNLSKNRNCKIAFILLFVFITFFCIFYYKNIGAAALPHFWGIIRTWESVKNRPYGHGIGTGGNMAQIFSNNSINQWLETGGETALMSYMYQIGIQGVISLILTLKSMSLKINNNSSNLELSFYIIPFILLGVSLLQDNTFSPQCIVPFMVLQGAMKNRQKQCIENKNKYNEKGLNFTYAVNKKL